MQLMQCIMRDEILGNQMSRNVWPKYFPNFLLGKLQRDNLWHFLVLVSLWWPCYQANIFDHSCSENGISPIETKAQTVDRSGNLVKSTFYRKLFISQDRFWQNYLIKKVSNLLWKITKLTDVFSFLSHLELLANNG